MAQEAFRFRTHGGKRAGAGRPGSGRMPHGIREEHESDCPVHVTLKVGRSVPNLRKQKMAQAIGRLFRRHVGRHESFRVVVFSIQTNHLHLIVEADDSKALSKGLQGLSSTLGRTINRQAGRRGTVFADRYHKHTLRSLAEVRHALIYVLQNHAHHGGKPGIDLWSSAPWFPHWRGYTALTVEPPVATPRTWKLSRGFLEKTGGPLDPRQAPR